MVCLPTTERHMALWRYTAQQGLNIKNNDDDDEKDYVMMIIISREWVVTAAHCVCNER